MIAPAFSFSVGDFIAGFQIAKKAVEALSDANGAPPEYEFAMRQLRSLEATLQQVLAFPETSATSKLVQQVQTLALGCEEPVSKFLKKMEPYEEYLALDAVQKSQQDVASSIRRATAKVRWALSTMKDLQKLNAKIAPSLNQIMILLQLIAGIKQDQKDRNPEITMRGIQDAFQQATLNISQRKDQLSGEIIHIHVTRYHSPKRCSHMLMVVPFEYFRYWSVCGSYLLHELKHIGGIGDLDSDKISNKNPFFCFRTDVPDEDLPETWQHYQRWDKMVTPGAKLELQIVRNECMLWRFFSEMHPHALDTWLASFAADGDIWLRGYDDFAMDTAGSPPPRQSRKYHTSRFMESLIHCISPYPVLSSFWRPLFESVIEDFREDIRAQDRARETRATYARWTTEAALAIIAETSC